MHKKGILYLVATPIGNLGDITQRALDVLKQVHCIAAEDTRHTQVLLRHFGIATPLVSYHNFNETQRVSDLMRRLKQGDDVALVSDAGTPLISDPGYRLVAGVHVEGIRVVPIPGACSAIAALIASGLPTDRFVFEGFLPAKESACRNRLQELVRETRTLIFYISVHHVVETLQRIMEELGGDRVATVARELTKTYETVRQDTLSALYTWIDQNKEIQRGEWVLIVQGKPEEVLQELSDEVKTVLKTLLTQFPLKQAVEMVEQLTHFPHKLLYRTALELKV